MANKTIVIVSGQVDATIKEYQPDVDFKIFRTIDDLGNYLDKNPIRAQSLFFTKDVVGGLNSAFTYMRKLCTDNDYLTVDKVIYITDGEPNEMTSLKYLMEEYQLENWDIVKGSMSRAFIAEVINGTFRGDKMNIHRKAVMRYPRADYVKQQLRNKDSLEEEYADDETDLGDIPDEEVPLQIPPKVEEHLQQIYIAGLPGYERTAFALLAAQYLSLNAKTIIVESDPDYHMLTEMVTKSNIDALHIEINRLYEEPEAIIQAIRDTEQNLIILECIDRIQYDYRYMCSLLYYNLMDNASYLIREISLEEIMKHTVTTVTVPSTVIGALSTGERVDKSLIPYCRFVGINLQSLPELRINSGVVMSTILNDILSTNSIVCPVITMSSLRLNSEAYDLGLVLGREVL